MIDEPVLWILGQSASTTAPADQAVRAGFPVSVVPALACAFCVPRRQIEVLVGIPKSTAHRIQQTAGKLTATYSDRAYRLARALATATSVLDSREKAQRWFAAPNRALGGRTPLEMLDTDPGTERVIHVLMQIEHSVY